MEHFTYRVAEGSCLVADTGNFVLYACIRKDQRCHGKKNEPECTFLDISDDRVDYVLDRDTVVSGEYI